MKLFLTCAVLLSACWMGWEVMAEPRVTAECRPGECPSAFQMDVTGTLKTEPRCVGIMEAAMRAMEPFLGPTFRLNFYDGTYWIERELAGKFTMDTLLEAETKWDLAMRECWSKP